MPVLNDHTLLHLERELKTRYDHLAAMLKSRALLSNKEGCSGHAHWISPHTKLATTGTALELRLAVEDFNAVLKEIKSLK